MTFTPEQTKALQAPLDRSNVATRQQAGRALSYIEGWHAIAEANRIFGFDGWYRETVDLRQLGEPREVDGKFRVDYMAKVRITVGDIVRDGCGFGQGIDKDRGQAHESALKEAETDAMKRALMTFGNPFGLALYDKSQASVADAPREQPIAELTRPQLDAIAKLDEADTLARLGVWLDDNKALIDAAPEAVKRTMRASYSTRKKAIEAMDRAAA
jgi:DNA recombination protein Rad52